MAWYFWTMKAFFVTTAYKVNATAPAGYFKPPAYCSTARKAV